MSEIHYFDDAWRPAPDGLNWRYADDIESGAGSQVVAAAWVRWGSKWGTSTFRIVAWDRTRPIAEADVRQDYWQLPAQARSFTAEGRRQHSGVIPHVSLLRQAK